MLVFSVSARDVKYICASLCESKDILVLIFHSIQLPFRMKIEHVQSLSCSLLLQLVYLSSCEDIPGLVFHVFPYLFSMHNVYDCVAVTYVHVAKTSRFFIVLLG